ncbi:MAG: DUF6178 family protein [Myxococcota bacterium]
MTEASTSTPDAPKNPLARLVGQSRLPAELRDANGMRKLNWILDRPDPEAFVGEMAPGELYFLLRDVGMSDGQALVELATDEQLRGLLDLDLWSRHEIRLDRWIGWLELALSVHLDTALRMVRITESELIQLLFTRRVQVHGHDLDVDMVSDDYEVYQTPDGAFWVTISREDELAERLPYLMKVLWASDADRMRDIFQTARFDLATNVEEELLRFRGGRLEDMGFVAPDEALSVYTFLPPKKARDKVRRELRGMPPVRLPDVGRAATGLALRNVEAPRLLGDVLARLDEETTGHVAEAFGRLVNKVFMAWTGDLSHTDHLPAVGRHVASLVNLGLGYLADESVETGVEVLARVWPEQLFQVGYSLTFTLARRARRIRRRSGVHHGFHLFGAPADDVLEGVSRTRPMFFEGLDPEEGVAYRDFRTLHDVSTVEVQLEDADAVLTFFEERLGFSPEALIGAPVAAEDRESVRFRTLFRTGVAQLLLTEELKFEPLSEEDLAAVLPLFSSREGGEVMLSPTLRRVVVQLGEHVPPRIVRWMESALEEMVLALGRVEAYDLDPRYAVELLLVQR